MINSRENAKKRKYFREGYMNRRVSAQRNRLVAPLERIRNKREQNGDRQKLSPCTPRGRVQGKDLHGSERSGKG